MVYVIDPAYPGIVKAGADKHVSTLFEKTRAGSITNLSRAALDFLIGFAS